jgi:PIN domain nuclease of toxin-antitoxin system
MRLLLDTQIFVWFIAGAPGIPRDARRAIQTTNNDVFVSATTIWEIAVKAAIGKVSVTPADLARLPGLIEITGFAELPVFARHAAAVRDLPMHHRDPFDRLLIAQARAEGLTLVTADEVMRRYDVAIF